MGAPRSRSKIATFLAVAACCAMWAALGSTAIANARKHDFLDLYMGATLARQGNFSDLHSQAVQFAAERRFVPEIKVLVPFVRPHVYALMLTPLSLIPYRYAFWCWIALQAGLLAGCCVWAARKWGGEAIVFGAMFLPTALGIIHGQDCIFLLVIFVMSYVLAERHHELGAGAVLGLAVIKFQLVLLWPIVLLLQKRWRMAIGFCGVGLGMAVLSMLLGGVHGTIGYVQLLTSPMMDGWNPSPLNFANGNMAVRGVLMVAVVACVALTARRQNLWRTYALAAVGCILSTPHVYGYDMALLLLPLWLAVYEGRHPFTRLAATALLTPLPFLLSLAGPPWTAVEAIALFAFLIAVAVVEPRGERAYQEFCIPNYFEKSLENAPR